MSILFANLFTNALFIQFMSIGNNMISYRFLATKVKLSSTRTAIWRKSDEMRIEIEFLASRVGFNPWTYFISQSKIVMSQWTDMSMSSRVYWSHKYFSKYFMYLRSKFLSHLKSCVFFLASSQTWIKTWLLAEGCFYAVVAVPEFKPLWPPKPKNLEVPGNEPSMPSLLCASF